MLIITVDNILVTTRLLNIHINTIEAYTINKMHRDSDIGLNLYVLHIYSMFAFLY